MEGWKEYKLSRVTDVISGYAFKGKHFGTQGKKVVKIKNIRPPNVDTQGCECVDLTEYNEDQIKKYSLSKGDVLVAMTGATIGKVGIIKQEFDGYLNQRVAKISPTDKINPIYLQYLCLSSNFQDFITSAASGSSVQENVSATDIGSYEILLPPLPVQEEIAEVLGSLDEKIDLLHRQNKTLEAMAEALFRQWFIEEAQDDWEEVKLGDVVEIKGGTTPSTKNPVYWNGNIHWTSPKDITKSKSLYLFDTERKITKQGLIKVSSGLLPVGSLLMTSRAPVGKLAFTEVPIAINQGYIGIISTRKVTLDYMYFWLLTNMDYVQSYANGSTFQEISKSSFRSLDITIPPKEKLEDFINLSLPTLDKVKRNQIQIQTLERLRDGLLPKLMSGEVLVGKIIKTI